MVIGVFRSCEIRIVVANFERLSSSLASKEDQIVSMATLGVLIKEVTGEPSAVDKTLN